MKVGGGERKVSQWRVERMHFQMEYGVSRLGTIQYFGFHIEGELIAIVSTIRYPMPKYWPCTLHSVFMCSTLI